MSVSPINNACNPSLLCIVVVIRTETGFHSEGILTREAQISLDSKHYRC